MTAARPAAAEACRPRGALHHVALGARDVARVARFYAEGFGLVECARHRDQDGGLRSVWLDLGGGVLMIERTEQLVEPRRGVAAGPFLLAFHVASTERASVELRLASLGGPIEERSEHTSYARDPEGHRVAISDYPLPPPSSASPR